MFSVNQKVVCIDADDTGVDLRGLTEGAVYTVSAVRLFSASETSDPPGYGIRVAEILMEEKHDAFGYFRSERFRPIVSRKTSIEIFQRMLTPKQKELAR